MARLYSLPWRFVASQYVANIAVPLGIVPADPYIINLTGSYGKDIINARSVEVDASLTSSPFTLYIDGVPRIIKVASYSTWNFAVTTNELRLTGGTLGDYVSLNIYQQPQTEWR